MGSHLHRLAQYHDQAFTAIEPGSIDHDVIHVFVHGWQPGYRVTERLLATNDGVGSVPAWDPRLVNAAGRPLIADYTELLDALADLGEKHRTLWYSWIDESATDRDVFLAHRSRQATPINGRRLAMALQRAVPVGHTPRVHLIGHSHGCAVAAHAAATLPWQVTQLTLLDAPEDALSRMSGAADLMELVLPRLQPGRAPGEVFVDSYASTFGRPYHAFPGLDAVVDVQLTAPVTQPKAWGRDPLGAIGTAHLYPVTWYAHSVTHHDRGVGYGWSPLAGGKPTELFRWYRTMLPSRPLELHRRFGTPLEATMTWLAARPWAPHHLRSRPLPDAQVSVNAQSPTAGTVIRTEPGEHVLEFDTTVAPELTTATVPAAQTSFTIAINGVPAFTWSAAHPVPARGRYLVLTDARPGDHLLTLSIDSSRRSDDPDALPRHTGTLASVNTIVATRQPSWASTFSIERSAGTLVGIGAGLGALAATGAWWTLTHLGRQRR